MPTHDHQVNLCLCRASPSSAISLTMARRGIDSAKIIFFSYKTADSYHKNAEDVLILTYFALILLNKSTFSRFFLLKSLYCRELFVSLQHKNPPSLSTMLKCVGLFCIYIYSNFGFGNSPITWYSEGAVPPTVTTACCNGCR